MKHGWRPLQKYLEVHERVLRFNHKYMDVPKVYEKDWVTPYYLILSCIGVHVNTFNGNRVRVDLTMTTEVDRSVPNRPKARTFDYTFSANRPRSEPLIRYCAPHLENHPEKVAPHHKFHHKHSYFNGKEKIEILTDEERPHVGEFLGEVLKRF